MKVKPGKRQTTVLLHIIIWSILFMLPHLFISSDSRNVKPGYFPGSFFIITNLYYIGLFYLNAFVLYPRFLNKRKWWLYIFFAGVIIAASYYLKLFITKEWYPDVILDQWAQRILVFPQIAIFIISCIYRLIIDKIKHAKKQKEIIAEQLSVKLKFLRSQISPHFIFNVLTNLVALARKKSDLLEPALIKLSELMRYMLYESDENRVALVKEVAYLKSYIELQQLRFGNDVQIKTNFDIPVNDLQNSVEPMLLIPFVENAFKHGINIDNPWIEIDLSVKNKSLAFDVKNSYNNETDKSKDTGSGIGLENVRSRLLLLYPKQHRLTISNANNIFKIHLILQLK